VGLWRRSVFAAAWGAAWSLDAAGRAMTYLVAGALTGDELRAAIARSWEGYGLDESFVLSGLTPWENEFYDRVLHPADRILVVGCGSGRDLIGLLRRGHEVEGVEPAARPLMLAERMLEKAGLRATLHRGGIETAALAAKFDVVVFSLFCYGYIPEARARVEVLKKAKALLEPAGRVVILYAVAKRRRSLPIRLTRLVGRLTGSDWRPEPGDKVWVALADRRLVHFEHEFQPAEVEAEAHAAGLVVSFHRQQWAAPEGLCVLTV
jgi:SAM-dependent methyltransferase